MQGLGFQGLGVWARVWVSGFRVLGSQDFRFSGFRGLGVSGV